MRPGPRRAPAVLTALLTTVLGLGLVLVPAAGAGATPGPRPEPPTPTGAPAALGSHVVVFDPSMPVEQIQARADAIHAEQVDAEMGSDRWALLFKPGTYGTPGHPLQVKVGYDTEVAGLGLSPSDTVIHGKVEVYNRCLSDGPTQPYCVALNNFWRSLSNLTIDVDGTGQDGCRASANFWAVSQASSIRRVDVRGGNLSLMDYCTEGPQYASGGYLADSRAGTVINGSQQQWFTRGSEVGSWSNGVWNQVFTGTVGAPSDAAFPDPPYTTVDTTPVSREKPYLFVDGRGTWNVRVPDARHDSRGTDWADGVAPGRTVPLSRFFVARPSDSAAKIASEVARGRDLLLTPGVYGVDHPVTVRRDHTVVLGIGQATMTAERGVVPLTVADRTEDVVLAGVTLDAGAVSSPALLRVGTTHGRRGHARAAASPREPSTTLNDVYFRVGGPHVGRAVVSLQVDSDDVLIDHVWAWRADHGVEGFTAGASGDTDRWRTNTARNGVVVNGDRVTATGLFVEHYQQHDTVWNGEDGRVVFYQCELAYDPPTQADWTRPDGTLGWAGYKVGDDVRRHELDGGGVYVFNRNDPSIVTRDGFEAPRRPGVRMHHLLTTNLDAGTIQHVVDGQGDQVDSTRSGQPSYVADLR